VNEVSFVISYVPQMSLQSNPGGTVLMLSTAVPELYAITVYPQSVAAVNVTKSPKLTGTADDTMIS
jgi:hypothetical protein